MSQEVFKAPKAKRKHNSHHKRETERWSPKKRRRTKDDFFTFCNIVLEYTQFDTLKQEELRRCNNTSPLDSGGSTADSFTSESTSSSISEPEHDEKISVDNSTPQMVKSQNHNSHLDSSDSECPNSGAEDDSWELVTCFCMKPFSGRPMIECSECLTWIHLSCAKIRKSNIPEDFVCQKCRESKFTTRKSCRIRSEKKLMNA